MWPAGNEGSSGLTGGSIPIKINNKHEQSNNSLKRRIGKERRKGGRHKAERKRRRERRKTQKGNTAAMTYVLIEV